MSKFKADKQKISNALRLKSLKQRQLENAKKIQQINTDLKSVDLGYVKLNKKIIFDDNDVEDELNKEQSNKSQLQYAKCNGSKPSLFSSGSEDEEELDQNKFRVRSQFEGKKGQKLLEWQSRITDDRFKLDERFKESDSSSSESEEGRNVSVPQEEYDSKTEKNKNFEILQQVLGIQLPNQQFTVENKHSRKPKYIRFDPESKDASKFLKEKNSVPIKENNKTKTNKDESNMSTKNPVVSPERYFEVSSNLKSILEDTADKFKLSHNFCFLNENDGIDDKSDTSHHGFTVSDKATFANSDKEENVHTSKSDFVPIMSSAAQKRNRFFTTLDDSRLQEGIAFFKRCNSVDEIQKHWEETRSIVMEQFQKRRRTSLRRKEKKPSQNRNYVKRSQ